MRNTHKRAQRRRECPVKSGNVQNAGNVPTDFSNVGAAQLFIENSGGETAGSDIEAKDVHTEDIRACPTSIAKTYQRFLELRTGQDRSCRKRH